MAPKAENMRKQRHGLCRQAQSAGEGSKAPMAARIYCLPLPARQIISLTAHWLEVTDKAPVQHVATLDPRAIFDGLSAGKAVIWQDWTIRASPPRPSADDAGAIQLTRAIWVSSSKGFSPFPCMDLESVAQACSFIAQREARVHAQAQIEFDDEPCY